MAGWCAGHHPLDQLGKEVATEDPPLRSRSPFVVAKALAYWQMATYHEAYEMFACTGMLANHESPLWPMRFVTQRIIEGVKAIKAGRASTILLGNFYIWRDWAWAPDYMQGMVLMLLTYQPADYLIVSCTTTSLPDFAQAAFAVAYLVMANHFETLESLKRPADLAYSALDLSRIAAQLGWRFTRPIREIEQEMIFEYLP